MPICPGDIQRLLEEKNYISPWLTYNEFTPEQFSGVQTQRILLKKNQVLYSQGLTNQYIYLIKSGRVRMESVDNDGTENCIYIAGEGCLIGEESAVNGILSYLTATAIMDSVLIRMTYGEFLQALSSNPTLCDQVMHHLTYKVQVCCSQRQYFSKNATARVAITLLFLCARYGELRGDDFIINMKFTHDEVAKLTGLNRVTVTKLLKILGENNIIEKRGGYFHIKDMDWLVSPLAS